MMKLNSNVACIEYKNKVILANKLTGMWLRITKKSIITLLKHWN